MALQYLNQFIKQVTDLIPPLATDTKDEFLDQFREALSIALLKLDLVTRQEFDVQTELLQKTQLKLEMLEQKLSLLEK